MTRSPHGEGVSTLLLHSSHGTIHRSKRGWSVDAESIPTGYQTVALETPELRRPLHPSTRAPAGIAIKKWSWAAALDH